MAESIIGQFGVGFYSAFIVADSVEVITKTDGEDGVRWASDGAGSFAVADAFNLPFERGTQVNIKLRSDCREFSHEGEVSKIIKKFSQFIQHPIKLNGQQVNSLQAIWYREKREVTSDEYERFFHQTAETHISYRYMLHYATEVPLSIRAILYVPRAHNEKGGMGQEEFNLHLYCRKILIKSKCQELLPNYLRFVKGVVDCEDLPLNISRENYQDSTLIAKLRQVLTRRVLKMLEDELKRDPQAFTAWYNDFQNFLKEGISMDPEN